MLSKSQEMIYSSFEYGGIVLSEENIPVDHDLIQCHFVTQSKYAKKKLYLRVRLPIENKYDQLISNQMIIDPYLHSVTIAMISNRQLF